MSQIPSFSSMEQRSIVKAAKEREQLRLRETALNVSGVKPLLRIGRAWLLDRVCVVSSATNAMCEYALVRVGIPGE